MLNFNWEEQNNISTDKTEKKLQINSAEEKIRLLNTIIKKRKKYSRNSKNSENIANIKAFEKVVKVSRAVSLEEKKIILTEYEEMQVWIKTLLSIYGSIPNIIKIIDQIITNQAVNPFGASRYCEINTLGLIEKVIDFYERKNKLLNIYILIEKLQERATDLELKLIKMKYVNKLTIDGIAQNLGMERRSVYRRFESLNKKLASFALSKGWTTFFISSQLENEPWVEEQYKFFKQELLRNQKRRGKVLLY